MIAFDARHEKTDFKVLVVVIPKERLAGWGLAITTDYSTAFSDYIL